MRGRERGIGRELFVLEIVFVGGDDGLRGGASSTTRSGALGRRRAVP